jgi:hypothetical protein
MWSGGVLIFLIFPSAALFLVACSDLAPVRTVAQYTIPLSILTAFIPIRLMKSQYHLVIEKNSHAFDFKRMRWAVTASLVHVSGKVTTGKIAALTLGAGLIGMAIAKLPFSDWLGLPEVWRGWGTFFFLWSIGWVWICVFGGGDLYITWLVWRRSRAMGKPMLTAELLENDTSPVQGPTRGGRKRG